MASIIVIGSGSREQCIAWKVAQSDKVKRVFLVPGNAGTHFQSSKLENIDICMRVSYVALISFAKSLDSCVVIVGPEAHLAAGIADELASEGIPCFGPNKSAALIESSKVYAKSLMRKYHIPTASYAEFCSNSINDSKDYILRSSSDKGFVLKSSGLAAGKGVFVCDDKKEAINIIDTIFKDQVSGDSGFQFLIEERLEGQEISCMAFVDGLSFKLMPISQDYKRVGSKDSGPMTGGMGAICPSPYADSRISEFVQKNIFEKIMNVFQKENIHFIGVLYAGMILTSSGPKILEFNCRFGDPETQVVLPLLQTDLFDVITSCIHSNLNGISIQWRLPHLHACAIVLASKGYPGSYEKGKEIVGINTKLCERSGDAPLIFHAGTRSTIDEETLGIKLFTTSGRVLTIVCFSNCSVQDAQSNCLRQITCIQFDGMFYRKDVGTDSKADMKKLSYDACGVSIEKGEKLVDMIKPLIASTKNNGCISDVGGFAALYDLNAFSFSDPLLVASTDGVGSKLKITSKLDNDQAFQNIGIDLVAMCVNDILCVGAQPLFFLDYYATSKLVPVQAKSVISGICKGGETAEMPGVYKSNDFDVAGFVVGAVERGRHLPKMESYIDGDVILGLSASAFHSNGFSLLRKVFERMNLSYHQCCPWQPSLTLGEYCSIPTTIYSPFIMPLLELNLIKGLAHITGGGIKTNLARIIPSSFSAEIDALSWKIPQAYYWLNESNFLHGPSGHELFKVLNCGLGLILIVPKEHCELIMKMILDIKEKIFNENSSSILLHSSLNVYKIGILKRIARGKPFPNLKHF